MKKRLLTFAVGLGMGLSLQASAADDWWFDVEIIIFDRNVSISELNEQFADSGLLEPAIADMNLIEEYLRPNISFIKQGLKTCGAPDNLLWMEQPSVAQILADHETWQAAQPRTVSLTDSTAATYSNDEESTSSTGSHLGESDHDAAAQGYNSSIETDDAVTSRRGTGDEVYSDEHNDGVFSEQPEAEAEQTLAVSASDIAAYWVDFSGINSIAPVSVEKLSYCEPAHNWLSYQDNQWQVYQADNALPAPQSVPEFLDGRDWEAAPTAHLLPYDSLELTKLSRQIRQTRGLNRMLHVAWRQPVKFGENKAESIRIIGGDNYANAFTLNGEPVDSQTQSAFLTATESDDQPKLRQDRFFSELNARLDAGKPVPFSTIEATTDQQGQKDNQSHSLALADQGENPPIWELDGTLKVYLKYINRVPYLHIDSKMKYRQPIADSTETSQPLSYTLKEVPFHQVRRVISKQIHYFDHPMFGMVVEIRRHQQN